MAFKSDFVAKTKEGKRIAIEDEFIKKSGIPGDGEINIKVDWSTYGELARWMASYDEEEFNKMTKDTFNESHFKEWDDNLIRNAGIWLSTLYGTGEKFDAIDHDKKLPPDTPFIDIVTKGIKHYWDYKIRVISFYTGRQGLLSISVFDNDSGVHMFSFTSLELYLNFRAK